MREIIVGIDFGTTNTVITYFDKNKVNILKDTIFETIPSKICFVDNKVYCGNYIPINDNNNIIHSFKLHSLERNNTEYLLIFFKHLYWIINKYFNEELNIKAVITVPSKFNDKQRENIKYCFEKNNINIIRIINEPSAAGITYGLSSNKDEELIIVIDIGGGTTDITVLEKNENLFEVIYNDGLVDIGGNNFTELIINDSNAILPWSAAQTIKEKLTYLDTYEIKKYNYCLAKSTFERLSSVILSKIKNILNDIFEKFRNINYVLMVGGSSRIPCIQRIIKEIFLGKNIWLYPKLETVVSEGACLYGAILENKYNPRDGRNNDIIFMDTLSLSLGVELGDGSYSIIVPKNTPLPIKITQKYTTDTPTENSINVKVYQGERKIANKNILVGEFIFDKISAGGIPIIDISFKIDFNSIINVTITDRKSGIEKSIIIKDLPNIDIDNLLLQAQDNLQNDNEELSKIQHVYLIKNHIENCLYNLNINNLVDNNNKNNIINELNIIENNLENLNNLELIETYNLLQNKYNILGTLTYNNTNNDDNFECDNLIFEDSKDKLINKINLLLAKNSEYKEYLEPILEQLTYTSTTIDYISDKLSLIDELEKEDIQLSPKEQVNNLCLYLKNQIENNSLTINKEQNELLIKLIETTLYIICNNSDHNWEELLTKFNVECHNIYNDF